MNKVLVLDFDGVILESVSVKDQAIYELFEGIEEEKRQQILDLHRSMPGINRHERISMLLTKGLGKPASPDIVDCFLRRFTKIVWEGLINCPEIPGIRSFLDMATKQTLCYVASAAPQEEIRAVAKARDFSKYFVDILGTPPPKSDRLREIMLREQVPAESILFIGDKISDYKAACAAETQFLARKSSSEAAADFPAGIPVIDNFQDDKLQEIVFGSDQRK